MYWRKQAWALKEHQAAPPDVHTSGRNASDQRCRKRNFDGKWRVYEGGQFVSEGLQVVNCSQVLGKQLTEEGDGEREQLVELQELLTTRRIAHYRGGDTCVVEDLFAGKGCPYSVEQGSASLSVAPTSEEITVIVGEEFGLYLADNMGVSAN